MKLIFSSHALLKISQRNISMEYVRETVLLPSFKKPGTDSREERYRQFKYRFLKVIVVQKQQVTIVVTAHWVRKLPI